MLATYRRSRWIKGATRPKSPSRPRIRSGAGSLRILRVLCVKAFLSPSRVAADLFPGGGAGDLAEHRARHQSGAAGIVEVEQPADQFPRRIEPGDGLLRGVQHPAVIVDAHAAKGEGDAAGRAIGLV